MTIKAYYIDNPQQQVTEEDLAQLGVLHWKLDADNWEKEGKLDQICKERGYTYRDFINSEKIPGLQEKLPVWFEEHLHDDEEIRFFLGGSGYFDVRDARTTPDQWIRLELSKGDLIVLPAGIYHRFNPDEKMFFHVMRLFVGEPVWTPYNRSDPSTEEHASRKNYLTNQVKGKN